MRAPVYHTLPVGNLVAREPKLVAGMQRVPLDRRVSGGNTLSAPVLASCGHNIR